MPTQKQIYNNLRNFSYIDSRGEKVSGVFHRDKITPQALHRQLYNQAQRNIFIEGFKPKGKLIWMASVDLFGNPVKGDQHSAFFNKLTGAGGTAKLSVKEQFKLEASQLRKQREEIKYKNKLNSIQDARLKLQVTQARNQIRNPQVLERAKTKFSIFGGFFK